MKGRRKVKTDKWLIRDQLIREARAILFSRSETAGRFLRLAVQTTPEEPVGILAGSRKAIEGCLKRRPEKF
jgi:hypothetical protein